MPLISQILCDLWFLTKCVWVYLVVWMMFWLSKQPKWNKARAVRVSTSRYGSSGVADMLPGEEDETGTIDPKRRLQYTPLHSTYPA